MTNYKMTMNDRLRKAREGAGYKTATDAIDHFGWKSSTYRAHENGQNNFRVEDASTYASAYGVTAAWLLIGEDKNTAPKTKPIRLEKSHKHKHNCIDQINAIALLLRDDENNEDLLRKLEECIQSQKAKLNIS
jgi:hypothetical protein